MPLFFSLMTKILLTKITHFPAYFNSKIINYKSFANTLVNYDIPN